MENQIQLFENDEFGKLEILMIGDKPYFPATECAKVLGYSNANDAIIRHCKGVVKHDLLTNGGTQGKNYIPEGDLYRLIIRSKLPTAERFECWVFDEVLPTIRNHGAYITDNALGKILQNPEFATKLLVELHAEKEKNSVLQTVLSDYVPKARYCDIILQSKNSVPISLIAKDYGISAVAFNRLLHSLEIQFKICGTWVLYQKYASHGYTESKTYRLNDEKSVMHTCWTQKGRLFLYNKLSCYGIIPLMEKNNPK